MSARIKTDGTRELSFSNAAETTVVYLFQPAGDDTFVEQVRQFGKRVVVPKEKSKPDELGDSPSGDPDVGNLNSITPKAPEDSPKVDDEALNETIELKRFQTKLGKIEVSIRPEKPEAMLGEPMSLIYTVRNLSDQDFYAIEPGQWINGRPESCQLSALCPDGKVSAILDSSLGNAGHSARNLVPAGKSWSKRMFLPDWFEFNQLGEHAIRCRHELRIATFEDPVRSANATAIADVDVDLSVALRILPFNDSQMGALIDSLGQQIVDDRSLFEDNSNGSVVEKLTTINDSRVVKYFVQAITTPSRSVRLRSLDALAKYNTDEVLRGIDICLATTMEDMRPGCTTDELAESLAQGIRRAAVTALSKTSHPKAEERLRSLLKDPNDSIRIAVLERLGLTETPEYQQLRKKKDQELEDMINTAFEATENEKMLLRLSTSCLSTSLHYDYEDGSVLGLESKTRVRQMSEAQVREEIIEISEEIKFASYNSGCVFHEEGTSISVELGALSFDQLAGPKSLRLWTLLGMLPESIKVRVSLTIPDEQIEIDSRFENVLSLLDPINNLVSLNISFVDGSTAFFVDSSPLTNHKSLCNLSSDAQLSLEPLKDLPLSCLEVNVPDQEDLSPIGGITTLRKLLVPETKSSNCSFLENLFELEELHVLARPFYLSQLKNLTKLELLSAREVKFDLDSLRLESVKRLFISDSRFEGKNLAKCFPAAQEVYLYNTVLESTFDIRELSDLRKMNVNNSSLSMDFASQ